jgi:hypothetical protein
MRGCVVRHIMSAMSLLRRSGPGGPTRTFFLLNRRTRLVVVAGFAVVLLIISVVIVSPAGTQAGFSAWGKVALLAVVDIPLGWWLTRLSRSGVRVSAGNVTVRNMWRTRTIATHEIRDIILEAKDVPVEGGRRPFWYPRIWLTNGDSIWVQGLECGTALHPPEPSRVAALDELRALVGLQ